MITFKFKIKKIIESEIEIEAENKRNAVEKLVSFLVTGKEDFCENILYEDTNYKITLQEISNQKRKILFNKNDEINKDIINYLLLENENENEQEHLEVCCKKCGNCVLLEDIIHQLEF